MPEPATPPFHVVTRAPQSLDGRGMRVVAAVVLAGSALVTAFALVVGAWPVVGFTGVEAALVLGLLALHRRRAARRREEVLLSGPSVIVRRTDAQGRAQERRFDAYWARVRLEERPGRVSRLMLRSRRSGTELGHLLGEEGRRALGADLAAALRANREPEFDNPQLRVPERG